MDMIKLDIQELFDSYLESVGASYQKDSVPYREMRRAFYGAFGVFISIIGDNISELPIDQAIKLMDSMTDQVNAFWILESMNKN